MKENIITEMIYNFKKASTKHKEELTAILSDYLNFCKESKESNMGNYFYNNRNCYPLDLKQKGMNLVLEYSDGYHVEEDSVAIDDLLKWKAEGKEFFNSKRMTLEEDNIASFKWSLEQDIKKLNELGIKCSIQYEDT